MNKPQGNGLVELVDDREPKESSFFCMDLVGFITQEIGERGVTCAETIFIDGTDSWNYGMAVSNRSRTDDAPIKTVAGDGHGQKNELERYVHKRGR